MNNIIFDKEILAEFDNYSLNEKIIWAGKPDSKKAIIATNLFKILLSSISLLVIFLIANFNKYQLFDLKELKIFKLENFIFYSLITLSLLVIAYQNLYTNFFYVITPNSIIIKNGGIFSQFKTISISKIEGIFEQKSFITNKYNVSSISIWDGTMYKKNKNSSKSKKYYHLLCISNAPEILELIEQLRNEIKEKTIEKFNSNSIPKDDNYSDYATVIE